MFPINLEKLRREAKFWGKKKVVWSPLTRLKVRLNFATIYSRLRDPLAQPLKKREEEEEEEN